MHSYRYALTFAEIAAAMLIVELILGHALSGSVVFLALCIAAGGTVGVAIRHNIRK